MYDKGAELSVLTLLKPQTVTTSVNSPGVDLRAYSGVIRFTQAAGNIVADQIGRAHV